ncbi:MAG TPA: hypothetical protein VGB23_01865, partial [Nitrospirota bacterium]
TPEGKRLFWGRYRVTHRAADIDIAQGTTRIVDFINYNRDYDHNFPEGAKLDDVGDGYLLAHYDDVRDLRRVPRIAPLLSPLVAGRP